MILHDGISAALAKACNTGEIPTVAIIDTNMLVIEPLKQLLKSVNYYIQLYSDALDFLRRAHFEKINCLLLNVRMPEMTGLELQEELNDRKVMIPLIFITDYDDVETAVRAMKNGAAEFFKCSVNPHLLLESINKAIKLHRERKTRYAIKANIHKRLEQLTPRENEIMHLVVEGKLSKVIATQLNISHNTVELHRSKIMKKMQVKSLAALVHMALLGDLVEYE